MTDNVRELLPIGSVIRLRGAKKELMIYGICQTSTSNQKTYDYIGVVWPMGNLGEKTQVLFNHIDIEDVVFVGYDNNTRAEFMDKLVAYYETNK